MTLVRSRKKLVLKEERERVEKVLLQRDPVNEKEKKRGINAATGGHNPVVPANQPSQKMCLIQTNVNRVNRDEGAGFSS